MESLFEIYLAFCFLDSPPSDIKVCIRGTFSDYMWHKKDFFPKSVQEENSGQKMTARFRCIYAEQG